jgi:iron complex outermembrane receptor protein
MVVSSLPGSAHLVALLGSASLAALMTPGLVLAQDDTTLPEIRVIAPAPVATPPSRPVRAPASRQAVGTRPPVSAVTADPTVIDRDKVPSNTQTLTADDFQRSYTQSVTDALMQRVPGVSTTDVQGNGFTQDLRYRGFAASPLQGTPQGIAVYMNGIRLNEAFGDTVNWDLIPSIAIERADMWSSNPVFGLNALGGAVNMQMKNGFTYQGFEAQGMGGSYGRISGSMQYGVRKDEWALYLAAEGLRDQGWRYESPSELKRFYGDLGWRYDGTEVHLIGAAARNHFGVVGPTPVDLLARDWKSIYTWPQTTRNEVGLIALNAKFTLTDTWALQSNVYVRKFRQAHVDGNDAELERCSGVAANPLFNTLCLEDDGFPAPVPAKANFQILGPNNQPIPCPPGPGNQCNNKPWGTVDRTFTDATTVGGSLQASNNDKVFGHDNHLTVGASIDHSQIDFRANSELGYIYPNFFVGPNASIPGTGLLIHTGGNIGYSPVDLDAGNTYYGLYATDTFDVTDRLSATFGGRFNLARITMSDALGTSPDLNGNHTFQRFNPVAGLTYKIAPWVTAYGGYAEANRAPTPLELGCANPNRPCLLEGFLVADPPLQQVVSKTWEGGLRGENKLNGGRFEWKLGLFRADGSNDIISVASTIQGRGVFQNVAATRRHGLEASAQYQSKAWLIYGSYSYIDATYQFTGLLPSPNNPSADADGNVHVVPGKHIPMIPQHQFKAGADYAVTPAWKVGADLVVVGSQFYVGDDANQNDKLPAYWAVNLHTSYQIRKDLQVFGVVNNLFNRKYAAYGTYFGPESIVNAVPNPPTDQRTQTPAQPLAFYAGLRYRLP